MPTYDYKCKECDYQFEMFQTMTAEPIKNCPKCNGSVKRLIGTGLGPIFKGSGFYETDYKRNNKGNGDSAKKSETKKPNSDSSSTAKTASK